MGTINGDSADNTLIGTDENDLIRGFDGNDYIYAGGGVNTVNAGAGDDTILSTDVDTVDGGDGNDTWTGDYSLVNGPLVFTDLGTSYTLSNGSSITNVENLNLTTGSGDDSFSIGGDSAFVSINGNDGNDSLTIDWSGHTIDSYGYFYDQSYGGVGYTSTLYDSGTGQRVNWSGIDTLNVILGSADDRLALFGNGAVTKVDGGAGTNYVVADFSAATDGITFALNAAGTSTFLGQGSQLRNIQQVGITTGSGNDDLTGGDLGDTLDARGGVNTIHGGGGDDAIYSGGTGVDTVDGGDGYDRWTGDYSAATAPLAFTHLGGNAYSLSNGGSVTNVEDIALTTGSGNDSFSIGGGAAFVGVNGTGGNDSVTIDWSGHTADAYGYFRDQSYGAYGTLYDYGNAQRVDWHNIETIAVTLGSGNDQFDLYGPGAVATIDGGAGTNYVGVDFSAVTNGITFALNAAGTSTFAGQGSQLRNIQRVGLTTGSGNDDLTGGDLNDYLDARGGVNTLHGGGGDDTIYSGGSGVDSVDGGDGYDRWTGDFSAATGPLSLTHLGGDAYSLSNGGSVTNVEDMYLTTGSGDDSFSIGGNAAAVGVNGNDGNDSLTIDWSGHTADAYGYFRDQSYGSYGSIYDYGNAQRVDWYNIETIAVTLGSGNDQFDLYGPRAVAVIDGGAGTNYVGVDFSAVTNGITFALNAAGTSTFVGQGSQLRNIQRVGLTTGSGNDGLTGGDLNDYLDARGGVNTIHGGGGDDTIYSSGIDTIDGGAGDDTINSAGVADVDGGDGSDRWTGDLSTATGPLAFTHLGGNAYSLSNGGSVINVESMSLTTGSGDDSFNIGGGAASISMNAGEGTDRLTIDWSARTFAINGNHYGYSADYQYGSLYDTASGQQASWQGFEDIAITLGSGDDYFDTQGHGGTLLTLSFGQGNDTLYLGGGNRTADGGLGTDTIYVNGGQADYSLVTTNGVTTITDLRDGSPNGTNFVSNFEYLSFGDGGRIHLTSNNAPTVASPIADASLKEDTAWTFTIPAGTFADADGDVLTLSATLSDGTPLPAWLAFNAATRTFSGTPPQDFNGAIGLAVRATDRTEYVTTTFTLTYTPVNDAPRGAPTAVLPAGTEDTPYTVSAATLLAGFTDPDGDRLLITNLTSDHGTVKDNRDGTYTVTPSANYNGPVTLSYNVNDGNGVIVGTSLGFTLAAVGDAPVVAQAIADTSTAEGQAWTFAVPAGTFSDPDGDALTYSATLENGSPLPVWLSFDPATRSFTGTPPAGSSGALSLRVTASDGTTSTADTFTLTISVVATNHAPTGAATATLAAGTEDTAYTVSAANLLAGFSDVDGDTLSVTGLTADHGTVTANANGTFTVTPAANYNGAVVLSYTVSDSKGGTIAGSRSFTLAAVNDAPTGAATATLAAGTEDTAYTISAANLLAGFSDVDGDTLSVTGLTADHGTVTANADGTFTVTPAANYNGAVVLSYTVSDSKGGTIAGSRSFTLAAVNDAPTGAATATLAAGTEDTAYTVSAANLLAGFSDVDGDTLSVTGLTADHGTVTANADGTFTVTPAANYNGAVVLSYTVSDSKGGTIAGSRSFTLAAVNDAPVAEAASADATEAGAVINGHLSASDVDAGAKLAFALDAPVAGLVLNADGSWTFDPSDAAYEDLAQDEAFDVVASYTVSDEAGAQASSSLTITVTGIGGDILGTPEDDPDLTGTDGDDTIRGLAGNDIITGLAGADLLDGGDGNDVMSGGDGNDTLHGGDGNDTLNGDSGIDEMFGGAGNDTFVVNSASDKVYETETATSTADTGGTDTVRSAASYSIAGTINGRQFIENLTLAGSANINGTGNDLANRLTGNRGANILSGGAGNDRIDGGAGSDTMFGGADNDTYLVDNANDKVYETKTATDTADTGGTDTVQASVSYSIAETINGRQFIENLTLTGTADINATGNALANRLTGNSGANILLGGAGNDVLTGNAGNDTLNGGTGNDTMFGGAGNDIFIVDAATDRVYETTSAGGTRDAGGIDTVQASASYSIAETTNGRQFIENLTLTGTANINGTGNALANRLIGNSGANILSGGAGNDVMTGEGGNDSLLGGSGNDTLRGGIGRDTITGGIGADRFIFDDGEFGGATSTSADRIIDFKASEGDRIDLSLVDAQAGVIGDQGFRFIGTAAFSKVAGELRTAQSGGNTYVYGDTDGNGLADFALRLDGAVTLSAADFVL